MFWKHILRDQHMYFLHQALFLPIEALRNKRLDAFVESNAAIDHKKRSHSLGTSKSS